MGDNFSKCSWLRVEYDCKSGWDPIAIMKRRDEIKLLSECIEQSIREKNVLDKYCGVQNVKLHRFFCVQPEWWFVLYEQREYAKRVNNNAQTLWKMRDERDQ